MKGLIRKKLSFDKNNWISVKFGDVVAEPKESVKDAIKEGIEHVVGLEHIDPENVHLNRSAGIKESTSFTKKFSPEDVLFGRRRAYLKKAAQATFNGICSGDITVIRTKGDLISELLPFVVQNDKFFDYAIKHSAGGLSPRVKFKDLANYEFLLPPKNRQIQLAELLWSMDEVVQKNVETLKNAKILKHSERKKVFHGYDKKLLKKSNYEEFSLSEIFPVSECCVVCNNLRKPISKVNRKAMKGKYPYYGPTSILDHISEYRVDGKYVLIGEDGDHFLKYDSWKMTQYVTGKFNVNNHAHIIQGTDQCLTKWVYYAFQHRNIIPYLTRQGATRYKLNKESLLNIPMIVPPVQVQEKLIEKFDQIETTLSVINNKIDDSKMLLKSLINEVF